MGVLDLFKNEIIDEYKGTLSKNVNYMGTGNYISLHDLIKKMHKEAEGFDKGIAQCLLNMIDP